MKSPAPPYCMEKEGSGALPQVNFSGYQAESSGDFIQSVGRVAFGQGQTDDDRWIAQYAATCLNGDALLWYCSLEEEAQVSWRKLRSLILQKYPPHTTPWDGGYSAQAPTTPSVESDDRYRSLDLSAKTRGIVEVVGSSGNLMGYLCSDGAGGIAITTQKDDAAVGDLVKHSSGQASQIVLTSTTRAEEAPTCIGLAMMKGYLHGPNIVPDKVEDVKCDSVNYNPPMYYGVPRLSRGCVSYSKGHFGTTMAKELAGWEFCLCGESRIAAPYKRRSPTEIAGQKAAAAVWKYDRRAEELKLTWLMDNDEECELAAYTHRNNLESLHVHRLGDMEKVGRYILEARVRFVFQNIE